MKKKLFSLLRIGFLPAVVLYVVLRLNGWTRPMPYEVRWDTNLGSVPVPDDRYLIQRRKDVAIFEALEVRVKTGDAESQFLLAQMYQCEQGLPNEQLPEIPVVRQEGQSDAEVQDLECEAADAAWRLYKEKRRTVMLDLYLAAAEQGHVGAMRELGDVYADSGVPADRDVARRWWLAAAEKGDAHARCQLGLMALAVADSRGDPNPVRRWLSGIYFPNCIIFDIPYEPPSLVYAPSVKRDLTEARRWLRLASDQGLAVARLNLGLMEESGEGAPANLAEAVRLYRLAAESGDSGAKILLKRLHSLGQGVSQYDTATVSLRDSLSRSHPDSNLQMARWHLQAWHDPLNLVVAYNYLLAATRGKDTAAAVAMKDYVNQEGGEFGRPADPDAGRHEADRLLTRFRLTLAGVGVLMFAVAVWLFFRLSGDAPPASPAKPAADAPGA